MSMEWNAITVYLTRQGVVMAWAGEEAEIRANLMDEWGKWDDNVVGQPITGRIGLFPFEVLDYDKDRDMFKVRRMEMPPKL